MKIRKPAQRQFAVCVDNSEYPVALEVHRLYQVIPDEDANEDGDLRVVDESGEDYLYPADYFVLIDVSRQTAQALSRSFTHGSVPKAALASTDRKG
jgi:hypothetical protein